MQRWGVGSYGMLKHRSGSYLEVNEVLEWLDDLTDDDNPEVIRQKIITLQIELGDMNNR